MTYLESTVQLDKYGCKQAQVLRCQAKRFETKSKFNFRGNTADTRGTAFVIYEDIFDAKNACDHLSGFNVCNRYLVVLYYQPTKTQKKMDLEKEEQLLKEAKMKYAMNMK